MVFTEENLFNYASRSEHPGAGLVTVTDYVPILRVVDRSER